MLSLQNFAWALGFHLASFLFIGAIVSPKRNWTQCLCKYLKGQKKRVYYGYFEKGLLKTSIYHYSKQMIGKREGHQEVKKLLAIDERSEKDELRRLIVKLAEANERAAPIFNRLAI